jgi:hypothetical protein
MLNRDHYLGICLVLCLVLIWFFNNYSDEPEQNYNTKQIATCQLLAQYTINELPKTDPNRSVLEVYTLTLILFQADLASKGINLDNKLDLGKIAKNLDTAIEEYECAELLTVPEIHKFWKKAIIMLEYKPSLTV